MPAANITARRPRVFIGADAQAWHSSSADFAPGFESIAETGLIKTLATLDLLTTLESPESLSPRANPARWREGDLVRIEIAQDDGSWFQWGLLRILTIPSGPNDDGSITLDLGCWLAWADGPQREGDKSAVNIGAGQNSAAVAARLLEESGIPTEAIDLGTWPYTLAWPLPKEGNGSYVAQAGALAWADGHRHLYQEPDGVIRAVQWSNTAGTPVAAITLGQGEVLFRPNPDPVPPAERVVVSGQGFEVVEVPNQTSFSFTVTEPASNYGDQFAGTTTLTTTTINRWGENLSYRWTQQEIQQRVPRVLAFVGGVGGLQRTTLREISEQRYNLTTGLLYQEIFTQRGDVRTFIPDGRSGSATISGSNTVIRETITDYTNDLDAEIVTARVETTKEPLYIVAGGDVPGSSPLAQVDAQIVETTWREERPELWIERVNTRQCAGQSRNGRGGTLKPTAMITERPQARESSPPATKRWQDSTTLKERQLEGVALWQHPGGAVNRDRVRPLTSTPAFSNEQCFDLAVAEVALLEGRRESYLIELPLSDALLWCAPLSTITVNDGDQVWTFKADALTWEYFTDSAKLLCQGVLVDRVELPEPVGVPLPDFAPGLVAGQEAEPEPPPFVVGTDDGDKTIDVEIVGLPMQMAAVVEAVGAVDTVTVSITGQPMTMAAVMSGPATVDVAITGQPMTMAAVMSGPATVDVAITGMPMTMAAVMDAGGTTDPEFANVSLLLHMDGTNGSATFTDSSSNDYAITANGNAQITTTDPKFGTGAGLFDGTGDYLEFTGPTGVTGDFTIEIFTKANSVGDENSIFCISNDSTINIFLSGRSNGYRFFVRNDAGTTLVDITGGTVSTSAYQYVAARVVGTTATIWVNGVQVASGTLSGTRTQTYSIYRIGRLITTVPREWNGRLDELRFTTGVARDVSVVPTAPFPDA